MKKGEAGIHYQYCPEKGESNREETSHRNALLEKDPSEYHRKERSRLVKRLPIGNRDMRKRIKIREDTDSAESATKEDKSRGRGQRLTMEVTFFN